MGQIWVPSVNHTLGHVSWWLGSLWDPFEVKRSQWVVKWPKGHEIRLSTEDCKPPGLCQGDRRVPNPTTPPLFWPIFVIWAPFALKFWREVPHMLLDDFEMSLEALDCLIILKWGPPNVHYLNCPTSYGFWFDLIFVLWTWKYFNIIWLTLPCAFECLACSFDKWSEFWPLMWLHRPWSYSIGLDLTS